MDYNLEVSAHFMSYVTLWHDTLKSIVSTYKTVLSKHTVSRNWIKFDPFSINNIEIFTSTPDGSPFLIEHCQSYVHGTRT